MLSGRAPLHQRRGIFYDLSLLTLVLAFVAINARWIWIYRHGLALDVDEAGYLSFSIIDYYGLHYGGLRGWIATIESPNIQAPLTMALASLLYEMAGPHVILGFAVPLGAGAAGIVAAYALGRSVGSQRVGLMAAVLVASCPVIINYSRSYQFSMVATLTTTLALLAILRSRRFGSVGWAAVFGVCLGAMPLARTMTLAFIPGLVAAAFVLVVVDPVGRIRRILTLGGALVLAVLVSATWLWTNGALVAQYLLGFGYGAHALEYGPQTSKLGLDAWLATAQAFIREVYFPHFLMILLGAMALLGVTLREAVRHGTASTAHRILRSPVLPVAIFAAEALLVLTTTSNKGTGFFAPIVPALMVLTAWAFERIGDTRPTRAALSVLVATGALMAAVPLVDLHTPFAPEWVAELPIIGPVTVTQGRGTIQLGEASVGYGARHAVQPFDNATSRAWVALSTQTASILTQEAGQHAIVAFGFRNALYNVNTVNLQHLLDTRSAFGARIIDPIVTGESVEGYLDWLRREGADACVLLTSDRPGGDFAPAINRPLMEEAARRADFMQVQQWPAPDGQNIVLWKHRIAPPNCK
ncbi:MAG: glycosyltransferase family 39 protein [Acetobacteraceae bacterium]|nr:glycosyltransferase family 39 protein [Acetobacteraceae bacterium]